MKKIYFVPVFVTLLACMACEDWLTVEPETSITGEKLFSTDEGVLQGLNGLYLNMRGLYYPEGYFGGANVVEYMGGTYNFYEGTPGYYWSELYNTSDLTNDDNWMIFQGLYNVIANANSLIEGTAEHREGLDEDVYNIGRGEALAIRAYMHFDLIRLYGPVPTAVNPLEAYLPYVRVNDINNYEYVTYDKYMEYLQSDLDSAETLLAKSDLVIGGTFEETEESSYEWSFRKSHFNYYGVLGLQARVNLWLGDTEEALRYARLVKDATKEDGFPKVRLMNTQDTSLYDNTTVDLTAYCEHLIGVKCDHYDYTRGAAWRPNSVQVVNSSSDFVDVLFANNTQDKRYSWFWSSDRYGNNYIYKYMNFYSSSISQKNFPMLRLAEIYLIIAETAPLDEANEVYEEYCISRNVPYVPLSENDRQERILVEYIREFAGEGQNFFAYKRRNAIKMLFGVRNLTEDMYRMVIPEEERLTE